MLRYASIKDVPSHLISGTPAEEQEQKKAAGRAKYRNKFTWVDDKRFDSALEAKCYQELTLRWKAGDIRWFVRQVPFELPGGVVYRADFLVVGPKQLLVLDVKGFDTQDSRNKRKQVKAIYGVDVVLWRGAA